MTPDEWATSTDLWAMIAALGGEVSDSKLRLFACMCCRRIWNCIDTDLHRRAVEYAEWFARGPGRDLLWLGHGHWTTRQPSRQYEEISQTPGWADLRRELEAERLCLSEDEAALRYDWWTPRGTAASVLDFLYGTPFPIARGVASILTAPYAYWQHDRPPVVSDEEDERWVARIDTQMALFCDLLRQSYGPPDLAEPGAAADGGA